uniref:Nucleoplasmin-3 n=1 Tax=Aotus nancymaae TaxID=37293 RepID=A0A2K5CSX4_AOTNA
MATGTAAALAFLSQESRTRAGGVRGPRVPALVTMDSFFFGCELSGHTRSFTFKVEEEDDAEHMLALTMLCLTKGAKDECNVVEVVAQNHDHQETAVPVANLKLSCQPMLSLDDFQLQPPVTFHLKSGSGPVWITGWHQIVTMSNDVSEEEIEEEEEDSEEGKLTLLCSVLFSFKSPILSKYTSFIFHPCIGAVNTTRKKSLISTSANSGFPT